MEERRILCVGLCCVDIISVVESYPQEDTDQRSSDYYWQRGGNASNTSSVLALLGANTELMGTLVKSLEYEFLQNDLASLGIKADNCVVYDEGRNVVAIVIINKQNGSRTIMCAINGLEIKFEEFDKKIDLHDYKWIHFEGRQNKENILKMMKKIVDFNSTVSEEEKVTVSLECEKVRMKEELSEYLPYPDVVFISKEFAACLGYSNMTEAVENISKLSKPGSTVICAWGEEGAAGKSGSCDCVTSPIFPPKQLVNTLAAGDTFNAGAIYALSEKKSLQEAIIFGCKVAGAKCGMTGVRELKGFQQHL